MADSLTKAKDLSKKVAVQFKKLENAYQALCDTEPDDIDALYTSLEDKHERYTAINSCLVDRVKVIEDAIAAASASTMEWSFHLSRSLSSSSYDGNVIKSLKPFKLTCNHTPKEFRTWLVQFHQYFSSGSISQKPLGLQRAFFDWCLDVDLLAELADIIHPTTDIHGPEGCLKILEDKFCTIYPLFNHCWNYFQSSHKQDKTLDAYLMSSLYNEADIKSLSKHDNLLIVFWPEIGTRKFESWFHRGKRCPWKVCKQLWNSALIFSWRMPPLTAIPPFLWLPLLPPLRPYPIGCSWCCPTCHSWCCPICCCWHCPVGCVQHHPSCHSPNWCQSPDLSMTRSATPAPFPATLSSLSSSKTCTDSHSRRYAWTLLGMW